MEQKMPLRGELLRLMQPLKQRPKLKYPAG
jgi:hypothetical protein